VKKLLKSVYIYGSYRKIKTGLSLFLDHSVYVCVGVQVYRHSLGINAHRRSAVSDAPTKHWLCQRYVDSHADLVASGQRLDHDAIKTGRISIEEIPQTIIPHGMTIRQDYRSYSNVQLGEANMATFAVMRPRN